MKSSKLFLAALVIIGTGGIGAALWVRPAPAAESGPSSHASALPIEEIARRLIRSRYQGRDKLPERVTFASVVVKDQGSNNFTIQAKFTVRGYYSDQTTAFDYDQRFLLSHRGNAWEIVADVGSTSPARSEPKSVPPPLGETDVSAAAVAVGTSAPAKSVTSGDADNAVSLGKYVCVMYAGGQLINVGGFTLESGGAYHDLDNGRGTFVYDAGQHQISFRGAAMNGQVGRYTGNKFVLKSDRNSVDCDRGN